MRRLILSCVVAVTFLLLGSAVSAQTPSNATIDNIFTSVNFTGVSTIFVEGQEIYANGFGFQDFHFTVPMTPRSRFRIASNTKLYTAIALWQLHERGLITMSDSIVSYLDPNDYAAFGVYGPYCPQYSGSNQCQPITFIDLLGMTSCIPNSVTGEVIPYAGSVAEYIGKYYISRELVCQPGGSTYYYSNAAFVWATYFIEKFTGMSYGEYIKRHITEPLGLHDTYYDGYNNEFGADWKRTEEYVQYLDPNTKELVNRGRCSTELDLGSINGAGGIISTVGDEATLWSKVFNFNSTTSPIFSNISTLYELVAPHVAIQQWNATHTQYYTQGLAVIAESTTQKIPNVILYEGGLLCSLTANLMFIPGASATASKTIVQAWTSSPSVFATEAQLQNVVAKQRGDAASIVSSFKRPYSDPATLAWAVADLLGFPETSTPKEHSRVRRA